MIIAVQSIFTGSGSDEIGDTRKVHWFYFDASGTIDYWVCVNDKCETFFLLFLIYYLPILKSQFKIEKCSYNPVL